jgi:hypothetical protein
VVALALAGALAGGATESPDGEAAAADAIQARMQRGVELARNGELGPALDEFVALRDVSTGAARECATWNWARALHERSMLRDLPASPPSGGRPAPSLVADARARLAAMRSDLVAARGGLVELLSRSPPDAEARAGLARVAARLRQVIERDREWRAVAERDGERSGGKNASDGRLRQGPSKLPASAGAPGDRRGESEEGREETTAEGEAPPDASAQGRDLTDEEARALRERLREVRGERRAFDERRADAAAARSQRRQ